MAERRQAERRKGEERRVREIVSFDEVREILHRRDWSPFKDLLLGGPRPPRHRTGTVRRSADREASS